MILELTVYEYGTLVHSAYSCYACDELLKIYDANKQFNIETLTRQQVIHLETITGRKIL